MKRVGKVVFYVIAVLLFGIFSQQETKAGEINERHYSGTYSVLSANVGNSDPRERERRYKLQSGPDEERVKKGIQDLKQPDILILIEASDRDQVLRICNSTGELYSVFGGPYDFICVKNDIGNVIEHVQMPGGDGNSVGYVDVELKHEGGRKVRLFYAHFPSPFPTWTSAKHKAHREAFQWICDNLNPDIPSLVGGDFNNDFTRGEEAIRQYCSGVTSPVLYLQCLEGQRKIHSSLYIEKRVKELGLWIFNPPAQPLQLQFLDGSTERDYEATYRVPPEAVWKTTIDWVMGKNVVPPFLAPGGPETDLVTGTTGTIRTNFVTSPPDWWKDDSRLTFDHKPLYGKVVFFWEDRIQPDILATYVRKGLEDRGFLELRKDNTCRLVSLGKWIIKVKQFRNAFTGEVSNIRYALIIMAEPLRTVEDEGDHDRIIMAEPLRERAGVGKQLISLNTLFVGDIEGETIIEQLDEEKLTRDRGAVLVTSSESKLWSSYLAQKMNFSLEFREDGSAYFSKIGKWEIKEDVLTIQLTFGDKEELLKAKVKDNTLVMEGGILVRKE